MKTQISVRNIPSVNKLLEMPELSTVIERYSRDHVMRIVREELGKVRRDLLDGKWVDVSNLSVLAERIIESVTTSNGSSLRRAINATGVVLHTGLGRARLADAACAAIQEVSGGHSLLELDGETGERGNRQSHVEHLLRELSGAEAAMVVNNNAGAILLAIAALAGRGEVLLSRGEMVEIGGSFRIPDVVTSFGAKLVGLGCTNRTRIEDYEEALTSDTSMILRCHPSNYQVVGFTQSATPMELAALANSRKIPFVDDLGSGAILDLSEFGVSATDTLRQSIESGANIVTASGDKLLGGPQAGIIVGKANYVQQMAGHPLARALRADKLTFAALEATLMLYRDVAHLRETIPTLRYLARSAKTLAKMADELAALLEVSISGLCMVSVVECDSSVGAGSLPGEMLPSSGVFLVPCDKNLSVNELAKRLRLNRPAIVGRIRNGGLLLDMRTLETSELDEIAAALSNIFVDSDDEL